MLTYAGGGILGDMRHAEGSVGAARCFSVPQMVLRGGGGVVRGKREMGGRERLCAAAQHGVYLYLDRYVSIRQHTSYADVR